MPVCHPSLLLFRVSDFPWLETAMGKLKPGQGAEIDDILAARIQHLGPNAETLQLDIRPWSLVAISM